jgi:hypothetical protein
VNSKTFQELHLGIFKPDDSYENCLKRVKNKPCGKIAEELHYAHRRNEAKDERIAELEKGYEELRMAALWAVQLMSGGQAKADLRDAYDKATEQLQALKEGK